MVQNFILVVNSCIVKRPGFEPQIFVRNLKKKNVSTNTRNVVCRKYNPDNVQNSTQYWYITNFCFRFLMCISLYTVHIKFFLCPRIHVDKKNTLQN